MNKNIAYSSIEKSATAQRQRDPPLYQMPHMWQPHLNMPNPYSSSHVDKAQAGWYKWGHDYPDMYSRKSSATEPDWYSQRVSNIRSAGIKELLWNWDGTDKATMRRMYDLTTESKQMHPLGRTSYVDTLEGQIPAPKWGLYHPKQDFYYTSSIDRFPSLYSDAKHV